MTVATALEEYLINHQIQGNSPNTIKFYRNTLGYFLSFAGNMNLDEIGLSLLREYYMHLSSRDITSVTVQTYIRALRAFLSWAFHEDYMPLNLSERFRLPKAKRKAIDVLTDSEIDTLLRGFSIKSFVGLRNYCICILMLDSGLRLNEVVTMTISSLHIPDGYVLVTGKGNRERFVPIGLHTRRYLIKYLSRLPHRDGKTPLFVKDTFTPIKQSTIKQLFRRLKSTTGITRLKPHLLRHTFATRYLDNGGDIYSLQSILGHSSLEMVKRYIHTRPMKTALGFPSFSPIDNLTTKPR